MKKILEIVIYDQPGTFGGITFGYDSDIDDKELMQKFTDAIHVYLQQRQKDAALLGSLIITASENLRLSDPNVAAIVRKGIIEFKKNQNDKT
jgi:hypothetical protein